LGSATVIGPYAVLIGRMGRMRSRSVVLGRRPHDDRIAYDDIRVLTSSRRAGNKMAGKQSQSVGIWVNHLEGISYRLSHEISRVLPLLSRNMK
jgi:hypothetical protein